jgi:hypothetical protein
MISPDAHQEAANDPMIASTLKLRLLLSNIRSIQCTYCVPPSSIQAQQHGDICIRGLCCAQFMSGSPRALSFSKSETSWNGNRITTSTSIRQTSRQAVFSDRG